MGGAGPRPDGFSAARSLFLVREAGRPVRGVRFSGGCFLTARGEGWRAFGGETEESAAGEFESPGVFCKCLVVSKVGNNIKNVGESGEKWEIYT